MHSSIPDKKPPDNERPSTRTGRTQGFELVEFASGAGRKVGMFKIVWIDHYNVPRCRLLPASLLLSSDLAAVGPDQGMTPALSPLATQGLAVAASVMSLPPGYFPMNAKPAGSSVMLVPDLRRVTVAPGAAAETRIATAFGSFRKHGHPWALCPYTALSNQVARLEEQLGLSLLVGVELEFTLLQPCSQPSSVTAPPFFIPLLQRTATDELCLDGSPPPSVEVHSAGLVPVDESVYCDCRASDVGPAAGLVQALVVRLLQSGIPVTQFHSEGAPGQWEVALGAQPAVDAVCDVYTTVLALREMAAARGLTVTFAPKVFPSRGGNGMHVNCSLAKPADGLVANVDSRSLFRDACTADERHVAEAFMAGVLEQLPSLLAVSAPTHMSHERMKPDKFACAFSCWGLENREAALRLVTKQARPSLPSSPHTQPASMVSMERADNIARTPPEGRHAGSGAAVHEPSVGAFCSAGQTPSHFEFRACDATANLFIVVAGIIASGLEGVQQRRHLPVPVQHNPSRTQGLEGPANPERLPAHPLDALDCFVESSVLRKAFGKQLFNAIAAAREAEAQYFEELSPAEYHMFMIKRY